MTKENKQMLTVAGLLLLKLVLIIGLFVWLTGCANTQTVENMKQESQWRAELAKDVDTRKETPDRGAVVLEVPGDLYTGPIQK